MSPAPGTEPVIVQSNDGGRSIDDLLSNVSASRLTTFHQCRLRFYFRYVQGLARPKSPTLHVGTSLHAVLKFWNRSRWKGERSSLRQLHEVYSLAWTTEQEAELVQWDGEEDEQKKTGWRLLETYFRESPIPADEKPEAVEVRVEADLASHGLPRLVGIIDLVRPSGRIVDFKSSGKTPDPQQVAHQTEIQTTAYSVLYREAVGKPESAIELHHLVKTKNPKLVVTVLGPATEGQRARLFRVIESYVAGLEAKDFVPSPGLQCASCQFFNECRAWRGL